jgi:microcystin-dependent protein
MGVVNTTYTFTSTDTITSAKMNNIIDDTTFTGDAIQGTTLQVVSPGKLAVSAGGITSNELASNSVTTEKLTSAITNSLVPSGAVMVFAMNSAPAGWLAANGSNISRTTYATLFTAIGTTYGSGDNSTTFTLPDLRGYFVRGVGTNSDGTVSSGTFGVKQGANVGSHTHATIITFNGSNSNGYAALSGQEYAPNASFTFTSSDSSQPGETRPANIPMLYCIKI